MASPPRPTVPAGPGSLAGDLLLLSVGHRGAVLTRGPLALVVAAGSLADELLLGDPAGCPAPARAELVRALRRTGRSRLAVTVAALVGAGALERHRTWARPPARCGLAVLDHEAVARARHRVAGALTGGPARRDDATLSALACSAGLARYCVRLLDDGSREAVRLRVQGWVAVLGDGPCEVVLALRHLLGRDGVPPTGAYPVLLPADDVAGYGDQGGCDSFVGGVASRGDHLGPGGTGSGGGGDWSGWLDLGGGFGGGDGGS